MELSSIIYVLSIDVSPFSHGEKWRQESKCVHDFGPAIIYLTRCSLAKVEVEVEVVAIEPKGQTTMKYQSTTNFLSNIIMSLGSSLKTNERTSGMHWGVTCPIAFASLGPKGMLSI